MTRIVRPLRREWRPRHTSGNFEDPSPSRHLPSEDIRARTNHIANMLQILALRRPQAISVLEALIAGLFLGTLSDEALSANAKAARNDQF